LSLLARECPMRYQFFLLFCFWGANPWVKVHKKRTWPATRPDLHCTILPNFIALR